jgi:hypothetical protein
MPIIYQGIFKRYNWRETGTATLVALADPALQKNITDDLNQVWTDSIIIAFPQLYLTTSDDINDFEDVLDGFVEDAAWNDAVSVVSTP